MFLKCEHLFLEDISIVISYENIFFLPPFPNSWKNLTKERFLSSRFWPYHHHPRPSWRCVFLPDAWHGVEKNEETYRFLHLKS